MKIKKDNIQTYTKQSYINTTLEELFSFHLDTTNLIKITPPNIKAVLLKEDIKIEEGVIIYIKTIKFFLPFIWKIRIKKVKFPNMLVDEALKSPFSFWEHKHIFNKKNNKVFLKDEVNYQLPLRFLSKLFDNMLKAQLEEMFSFRHKITKELLERKK